MRIKSYVFHVEREDGVLVRGAGRSFVIKGAKAYPAVSRLFALFDGRFTREQIERALPGNARPLFDLLVEELEKNAFLAAAEPVSELIDDRTRAEHCDTIAYLADWHASPEAAFVRWQNSTIAIVGDGVIASSAARGLAALGLPTDRCVSVTTDVAPKAALVLLTDDTPPDLVRLAHSADVIARAAPVLPGFGLAGGAQIGPLLAERSVGLAAILNRIDIPANGLDATADNCLRIAGGLMALEALNFIANIGSDAELATRMSLVDKLFHVSPIGLVKRHVIPSAYLAGSDEAGIAAAAAWPIDGDHTDGIYDPLTGLLKVDHARVDRQLPLHMFGLTARTPRSSGHKEVSAEGWGLTEEEAAYRAHLAVIDRYTRALSPDLENAVIAVCRDPGRLAAAGRAWRSAGPTSDRIRPPSAGHEVMLTRLVGLLSGQRPEVFAIAPASDFVGVDVRFAGTVYRCLAETHEAAVLEVLGALVAALQTGWDPQVRAVSVPALATLCDPQVRREGLAAPARCSDRRLDPVWRRLGWSIADLATETGATPR